MLEEPSKVLISNVLEFCEVLNKMNEGFLNDTIN